MDRRALAIDVLGPIAAIGLLAAILVLAAGMWPPMVAVESGSMEPHTEAGDLIVVSATDRFAGPNAQDGIVTAEEAEASGYGRIGGQGDVIVFSPPDREGSPIFHRAAFYVTEGEDWTDRADHDRLGQTHCALIDNCPAPHSGYITYGDDNPYYDQVAGTAPPVKPEWIEAKGQLRVPNAGWLRLALAWGNWTGPIAYGSMDAIIYHV